MSESSSIAEAQKALLAANFVYHGGKTITKVNVQPIFWGERWAHNPSVTRDSIVTAVKTIVAGQYMKSLEQYRHVGPGSISPAVTVHEAGVLPASPPATFSDLDVQHVISALCRAEKVQRPESDKQLFYCVFMQEGVTPSDDSFDGYHSTFAVDGSRTHYAWIMNTGSLASITTMFSHELVEVCTDPEGDGFVRTGGGTWWEIGDECAGQIAVVDGVTVQRYWSNEDYACVVPTDQIVIDHKNRFLHPAGCWTTPLAGTGSMTPRQVRELLEDLARDEDYYHEFQRRPHQCLRDRNMRPPGDLPERVTLPTQEELKCALITLGTDPGAWRGVPKIGKGGGYFHGG